MSQSPTIALVIGSFHKQACETMVNEALATAAQIGLEVHEQVWVPGSMEKPPVLTRTVTSTGVGILGPEIEKEQILTRLTPYARDAVRAVHAMLAS